MPFCNGTATSANRDFWESIDPIAVFALIAACGVIIIASCLVGSYAIWRLRRQFARKEPARLTYYSVLHSSYRRRASSPIMAFDNGQYIKDCADDTHKYCPQNQKNTYESNTTVTKPSVGQTAATRQPLVTVTDGKLSNATIDLYECVPSSQLNSSAAIATVHHARPAWKRPALTGAAVHGNCSDEWDDNQENTYEELPVDYENTVTVFPDGKHQRQQHQQQQQPQQQQTQPLYANTLEENSRVYEQQLYENFPRAVYPCERKSKETEEEEEDYAVPVPMTATNNNNNHSNYSSRTFSTDTTTDFEPGEKMLGTHANVTVISMSELSVDIRSCPDTPLLNRASSSSFTDHSLLVRANGVRTQHHSALSGSNPLSFSESHLGYSSGHYPKADCQKMESHPRLEQRSEQVDGTWEMRTSF